MGGPLARLLGAAKCLLNSAQYLGVGQGRPLDEIDDGPRSALDLNNAISHASQRSSGDFVLDHVQPPDDSASSAGKQYVAHQKLIRCGHFFAADARDDLGAQPMGDLRGNIFRRRHFHIPGVRQRDAGRASLRAQEARPRR